MQKWSPDGIDITMMNHFLKRTMAHIHRVQNNMIVICTELRHELNLSDSDIRELFLSVLVHDRSKFSITQFRSYVWITEYYRRIREKESVDDLSELIKELFGKAVEEHYEQENHHPQKLKSGQKWELTNVLECACDLQAMSQEFGERSYLYFYMNKWLPENEKYFQSDNLRYTKDLLYSIGIFFHNREVI